MLGGRRTRLSAVIAVLAVLTANAAFANGFPNDPGAGPSGSWHGVQWYLGDGPAGIGARQAWQIAKATGHPGGQGITVAILDTGVAYRNTAKRPRPRDLGMSRFTPGWDFVRGKPFPDDPSDHGTVIAALVGEDTNNGIDLAGLAYNAKIMPVRVLDLDRSATDDVVARGIRWAATHGADLINLSFNWPADTTTGDVRQTATAVRGALRQRISVIAAAGNDSADVPAYPARLPGVISVGATTRRGCVADYSNRHALLIAPGGGDDSPVGPRHCRLHPGRGGGLRVLDYGPGGEAQGSSFAAPLVTATAALVLPILPSHCRTPKALTSTLRQAAHDLGSGERLLRADRAARLASRVKDDDTSCQSSRHHPR